MPTSGKNRKYRIKIEGLRHTSHRLLYFSNSEYICIANATFLSKNGRQLLSVFGVVIVERIKDTRAPFYRPPLPEEECAGVHPDILTLMKQCWAEEPAERPSFVDVAKVLKIINKGKSVYTALLYNILLRNSFSSKIRIDFKLSLDYT